jgi:hypothetical protein
LDGRQSGERLQTKDRAEAKRIVTHLVDGGEVPGQIGKVNVGLHDVLQRHARSFEDSIKILGGVSAETLLKNSASYSRLTEMT